MLPYIHVFGKEIPMYGLCMMAGITLAFFFAYIECKKKNIQWENILIIGTTGLAFGILGAKLLYIFITFSPKEIWQIILHKDFSVFISGGFVFYGGLIFGVLGALLGAKIAHVKIRDYENIIVKHIPFAHAFGRIGCFFAGCCYGKPTEHFPYIIYKNPLSDAPIGIKLIPLQLYEALVNIIIWIILNFAAKKQNGFVAPIYMMLYSICRFILEYFRYDEIRRYFLWFSTSQWISICIFLGCSLWLVVRRLRKSDKTAMTAN